MAALAFVFITNELHVVSSATLQCGQQPPAIQITKHFSKSQVDKIKKEFEEVKVLGSATVEEWLKGLDGRGQERRNDAARWERWEMSGGVEKIRKFGLEFISKSAGQISNGTSSSTTKGVSSANNSTLSTSQCNVSIPPQVYIPTTQPLQLPQAAHPFGKLDSMYMYLLLYSIVN